MASFPPDAKYTLPYDVIVVDRRFVYASSPDVEVTDPDRLGDIVEILRDALEETLDLAAKAGSEPQRIAQLRMLVDGDKAAN